MMNEPISSIMTKDVITISPDATFNEVKKILFTNRIHHLPVVEKTKLVGIITSYDLVKIDEDFSKIQGNSIRSFMTKKIAKLEPEDKIGTAAEVFLENMFHGIPIVDSNNVLKGIVTTHDVLMFLFDREYPDHKINWRGGK
ncbi:MAG: CBS domain-containing protein [Saprospiraceae bacterium]|nr:CBS domain-containing protein [Saprospiraceae bacterium]MCB9325925.1 CBS domain-containing protein [Lewinellaceae bacterium]